MTYIRIPWDPFKHTRELARAKSYEARLYKYKNLYNMRMNTNPLRIKMSNKKRLGLLTRIIEKVRKYRM